MKTAVAGPQQFEDPAAISLEAFVSEVMTLLDGRAPPDGEVLVEEVKPLRFADRGGR